MWKKQKIHCVSIEKIITWTRRSVMVHLHGLTCRWRDTIVVNAYSSIKPNDTEDGFPNKLEQVFCQFRNFHTIYFFGYFTESLEIAYILKWTMD